MQGVDFDRGRSEDLYPESRRLFALDRVFFLIRWQQYRLSLPVRSAAAWPQLGGNEPGGAMWGSGDLFAGGVTGRQTAKLNVAE